MFNEIARRSQARWGHSEELLARICERLDVLLRVTVLANRDPKKSAPDMGPAFTYPRPGQTERPSESGAVRPRDLARRMLMGGA